LVNNHVTFAPGNFAVEYFVTFFKLLFDMLSGRVMIRPGQISTCISWSK
jgi:hypothetical protein